MGRASLEIYYVKGEWGGEMKTGRQKQMMRISSEMNHTIVEQ
jgi:hypothetical protein